MLIRIAICALLLTSSVMAEDRVPKAIDCSQLLTWVAAGIPGQRLSRLVRDRGVSFRPGQNTAGLLASEPSPEFGDFREVRTLLSESLLRRTRPRGPARR